jgi:hypothetical protein
LGQRKPEEKITQRERCADERREASTVSAQPNRAATEPFDRLKVRLVEVQSNAAERRSLLKSPQ